jgi:hypothetical protein
MAANSLAPFVHSSFMLMALSSCVLNYRYVLSRPFADAVAGHWWIADNGCRA